MGSHSPVPCTTKAVPLARAMQNVKLATLSLEACIATLAHKFLIMFGSLMVWIVYWPTTDGIHP